MEKRLDNKIAIVTGASRGIGKAISIGLALEGSQICLVARSQDDLNLVANNIRELGQEALVSPCDVTDETQVKRMVEKCIETFGKVDILVNNAGAGAFRPAYGTSLLNWQRLLDINTTSTFICTKHVWRSMRKQNSGSIINISSLSGTRAYPMYAAYSASKWGQIGFTKATAEEGKPDNIRVNAIAPGKVDTDMRAGVAEDKSRILKAGDCVGAVIFLASEESRFITGQVIEIEWFGPST